MPQPKLGIIAGRGQLPQKLARACEHQDRPFFVLALDGAADMDALDPFPHALVRLGAVGEALDHLRANAVNDVVLAGGVKRPSMSSLMPDAVGAKLIKKLSFRMFGGDDAVLKAIMEFLEGEGFRVVGAHDILGELIAPEGIFSKRKPDVDTKADIALGMEAARAIGLLDIGQAVIVENGYVLGVEAVEGTDALIARCAPLLREKKRAILVKACKPQQEDRADLPTVGPDTVKRLQEAGMLGFAVEAGGAILLEEQEIRRLADQHDMLACAVKA